MHLANKIITNPDYKIETNKPRLQNTESALRWRMCTTWNTLPTELRTLNSLPRFKNAAKQWIKRNRQLDNVDPLQTDDPEDQQQPDNPDDQHHPDEQQHSDDPGDPDDLWID